MEFRRRGRQFTWRLPPSPNHRVYRRLEAELDILYKRDPKLALAREAFVCLRDFYWFIYRCMPFGSYVISDPGHPMRGRLWVEHPWVFERIREIQRVIESRISFLLFWWARHHMKTTLITVCGSLWILTRDPQETVAIFSHKVDQIGEGIVGADIRKIIEEDGLLCRLFPQFRSLSEASDTRITVGRKHGPRDPSIAIHGIKTAVQSIHPTWILGDDVVGPDTVESKQVAHRVDRMLDALIPLRGGNTPIWFVGTPWGRRDPVVQRKAAGYFSGGISFHPSGRREGKPILRTLPFLQEQYKKIQDKALADAQFDLLIRDPHKRTFRLEDLRFYIERPEFWAEASNIHFIVDYAKGGEESDYTVILVVAIRWDRRRYILDLWREKMGQSDTLDCIFGPPRYENPASERHAWKPNPTGGGLVGRWQGYSKNPIEIWFETGGADAWVSGAKRELARIVKDEQRKPRCRVRALGAAELPKGVAAKSKVSRIRILDQEFRNGMIWLPAPPPTWQPTEPVEMELVEGIWRPGRTGIGFGHGSQYGRGLEPDERDTLVQFLDEEYFDWNEAEGEKSDAVDDVLDTLAWPSLDELKHIFIGPPAYGRAARDGGYMDRHSVLLAKRLAAQKQGASGRASWRVN